METNPYNELLYIIKDEVAKIIKPSLHIAKVVGTSPLTLAFEGIQLSKFYISDNLRNKTVNIGDSVVILRENQKFVAMDKVVLT